MRPLYNVLLILALVLTAVSSVPDVSARAASAPGPAAQEVATGPVLNVSVPGRTRVGQPFYVTLSVRNAVDVAGYETNLLFDTSAAHFAGLRQRNNDIRKFGRHVSPLGAVEMRNGIAFGVYSCPVSNCVKARGLSKVSGGARGTVVLGRVAIVAEKPGVLQFRLDSTRVVSSTGAPVSVQLSKSTFSVRVGSASSPLYAAPASRTPVAKSSLRSGPYDLARDGRVTHSDAIAVAVTWTVLREKGIPCGSASAREYDVNGDGCVDVVDAQAVAAHYSADTTEAAAATTADAGVTATAGSFVVNSTGDDPDNWR